MAKASIVLLIVLAASRFAFGSTLAGTVTDPQKRVIVGAGVRLRCGKHEEQKVTGPQGQFAFAARPSFERCGLTVSHPGFATFEKVLSSNPQPALIELQLAANKQGVIVKPHEKDLRQESQSSLGSASLSDADLQGISNSTADLVRYAKALAGADATQDAIYVDGLPSSVLPPAAMVGRIDINGDPFSAEYADNDRTHINITTKSADRRLRFNFGGAGLGLGGSNPLAPNLPSTTRSAKFDLAGPVPYAPFTFSLHADLGRAEANPPIEAVLPPGLVVPANSGPATPTNHNGSGLLNLHYSGAESTQTDFSYIQSQSTGSDVGVGGLTLPEAGSSSQYQSREARITLTKAGASYLYRGGFVFNEQGSHLEANSTSMGLTVPGSFVTGGAAVSSSQSEHTSWTWKSVLQSTSRHHYWTTGFLITRAGISNDMRPNPYGLFQFTSAEDYTEALAGNPTGTWFITRGNGQIRYANTEAAPFIQGDLFHSQNLLIAGGMRADYQSGGGILVSPRLSLAAKERQFIFRSGGGLFVHDWSGNVILHTLEDDGSHLQPYVFQNVSFTDPSNLTGSAGLPFGPLILSRFAPGFTRPRDWMVKGSVERPLGRLTPGLEYTRTDGQHLLGSQRLATQDSWLDVLESNRARRRDTLHARLQYRWERQSLVAHYERIQSRDNTDGPLSFPERQDDLGEEWARTAGISPHNFTLVDSLRLPCGMALILIATARSSAPYNITTGLDNGDDLYNDRGGRPRNSGNGPSYRSLDLFGSRRIPVPGTANWHGGRIYLSVGVQAANLLGNKNYLGLDSVASSSLFGRPLAASPGRAARLWVTIE